jgi:hypothetical protein
MILLTLKGVALTLDGNQWMFLIICCIVCFIIGYFFSAYHPVTSVSGKVVENHDDDAERIESVNTVTGEMSGNDKQKDCHGSIMKCIRLYCKEMLDCLKLSWDLGVDYGPFNSSNPIIVYKVCYEKDNNKTKETTKQASVVVCKMAGDYKYKDTDDATPECAVIYFFINTGRNGERQCCKRSCCVYDNCCCCCKNTLQENGQCFKIIIKEVLN